MPPGDAYRDELSAAQARIAELERLLAEEREVNRKAAAWAALVRERAHTLGAMRAAASIWPKFSVALVFLVSWLAAAGFFSEQAWFFGGAIVVAPFLVILVARRIARGNAAAASQQLALVAERIAEVEKAMKKPERDTGA